MENGFLTESLNRTKYGRSRAKANSITELCDYLQQFSSRKNKEKL